MNSECPFSFTLEAGMTRPSATASFRGMHPQAEAPGNTRRRPRLRRLLVMLLVGWTGAGCSTTAPASKPANLGPTHIEEFIAAHAARAQAREYPITRLVLEGDLNRDGVGDRAWVYRLDGVEGGEAYQQFLAVQVPAESGPIQNLAVGGSGDRSVVEARIVDGAIELHTQQYLPTDRSCCPTGHRTLTLRLIHGKLTALPASP